MFLKSKRLKVKNKPTKRADRFISDGEGVQFFATLEDYLKNKKEGNKNESL